jgi:outer membrane protein assembly factor BamB
MSTRRSVVIAIALAALATTGTAGADRTVNPNARVGRSTPIGPWDWPAYGHDAQRTFNGRTTLTNTDAPALTRAWFFPTGDAVTATPTVVAGTVYVGSWDDNFYAIDLQSGALRWKFTLAPQPAITPQPGQVPRDITSDGGMITSSAWFEPGSGDRPDLVIVGGGYTLYALDAQTGSLYWSHAYTGRPDLAPDPVHDDARIFSSPIVVDGKVIIGVSPDGRRGRRGYIVAASLATGDPVWTFETDVDAAGNLRNDGCGSVWSSATSLPRLGLVVFDTGDCHFSATEPYDEVVVALRVDDGSPAWVFRPARRDDGCDFDFGATANADVNPGGVASFLGVGGKDGTYYSLDPRTGQQRWATNVVFGGLAGGFIATTAYDGNRVYGSTALGDFGRFEGVGNSVCDASDPRDTIRQEPTAHAFDTRTGAVAWQGTGSASFAPTTVAGGMTFNSLGFSRFVQIRNTADGTVLASLPLDVASWSGTATVGNALVLGTGTSVQGSGSGVIAFTPSGAPPVVPSTTNAHTHGPS